MSEQHSPDLASQLRRFGEQKVTLPIPGERRISWLTLQAILFFVGCAICSCCTLSSFIWGSASPRVTLPALAWRTTPSSTPRLTQTNTLTPTVAIVETGPHTPTLTLTTTLTPPPTDAPPPSPPLTQTVTPATAISPSPTSTLASSEPASPTSTETTSPASPSPRPTALPTPSPTNTPTPTRTPQPNVTMPPPPTSTPSPESTVTPSPSPTSTPEPERAELKIVQVEYADFEEEFVRIENQGSGNQDMTGWTLVDENDNTYTFPDKFLLRREGEVRVWTASGANTTTDLYWGRSSGVWSSQGDTAYLRNAEGELVDSFTWTGDDGE